ncbi:hypothetical protein [Acidovorax kalamii]|uniref:hypothetical protein n=1 Tax=Acidovorax kalamii TaxID=2004485 RepID=UPI0020917424|nr:hypothetical protein [Acidovorax kalamii]MCO5354426.1 hypothetical protein [Acidovorax kalamii]
MSDSAKNRETERKQATKNPKGIDNFDSRQWGQNSLSWRSSLPQKPKTKNQKPKTNDISIRLVHEPN